MVTTGSRSGLSTVTETRMKKVTRHKTLELVEKKTTLDQSEFSEEIVWLTKEKYCRVDSASNGTNMTNVVIQSNNKKQTNKERKNRFQEENDGGIFRNSTHPIHASNVLVVSP